MADRDEPVDLGIILAEVGQEVNVWVTPELEGSQAYLDLQGRWQASDLLESTVLGGRARFARVPPGKARFVVNSLAGSCEEDLLVSSAPVEITCAGQSLTLDGQIHVAEDISGGKLVFLTPTTGEGVIINSYTLGGLRSKQVLGALRQPKTTNVEADGRFRIEGLVPGAWRVDLMSETVLKTRLVTIPAQATKLEIYFE